MKWSWLLPLLLGGFAVMQASLNRMIVPHLDLFRTATLNGLVFVAAGLISYTLWGRAGFTQGGWAVGFQAFRWWWLLPGCLGFCLVIGMPYAIARHGVLLSFVLLVAAQVVFGALWDVSIEGRSLNGLRLWGAALAIVAAAVSTFGATRA